MCQASADFDITKAQKCLSKAYEIAIQNNHDYVTLEHLLSSLLSEKSILRLLKDSGANLNGIVKDLTDYLKGNNIPNLYKNKNPSKTTDLINLIDTAVSSVMFSGRKEINTWDLLIPLMNVEDSHAQYFLTKNGVTSLK